MGHDTPNNRTQIWNVQRNSGKWRPRQEPDNREKTLINQRTGWGTDRIFSRLQNNDLRPVAGHVCAVPQKEMPDPAATGSSTKYQIAAWCDGYNPPAPPPATVYLMRRYGLPRTLAGTIAQLAGIGGGLA